MEQLLHYVWKHRFFPLTPLLTTDGQTVEVIDVGLHNHDAGPDFFNAKVRIGGVLWVGNVEIHLRAIDWQRHGHDSDAAYNNVVLHVVEKADAEVVTAEGRCPPTLVLPIPEAVERNYAHLSMTDDYPRCWPVLKELPQLTVHSWMSALLFERIGQRAQRCTDWLKHTGGDWEHTLFISLARTFGFGLNGDAFELWAKRLPLYAAAKHRDDLFQLEALFLGVAGLLENEQFAKHRKEWDFLRYKFQITDEMDKNQWRYLRLRPQNFPHVRILQLARLYHSRSADYASLMSNITREAVHKAFDCLPLSVASRDLIIINTVCPVLFAHGREHNDDDEQATALSLLEALPAEKNAIQRLWQRCGISVSTAADSQAIIQLKREYCDKHDCLRCRFGYEYMKRK